MLTTGGKCPNMTESLELAQTRRFVVHEDIIEQALSKGKRLLRNGTRHPDHH